MAKYLPLPKSLKEVDKTFVSDAIDITERRFKGDLFGEINSPLNEPCTTFDGNYHWPTTKALLVYITDLTETSDIRSANAVLYQTLSQVPEYEVTMTGASETAAPGNMPGNIRVKEWQEAEANRQARLGERAKSDVEVRGAITTKQSLYDARIAKEQEAEVARATKAQNASKTQKTIDQKLTGGRIEQKPAETTSSMPALATFRIPDVRIDEEKKTIDKKIQIANKLNEELANRKMYVGIQRPTPQTLEEKKQQSFDDLVKFAKTNPKQFTNDLSKEITTRLENSPGLKTNPDERVLLSKLTAYNVTSALIDAPSVSPLIQIPVVNYIARHAETGAKIDAKKLPEGTRELKDIGDILSNSQTTFYKLSQEVLGGTFERGLQERFLPDIEAIKADVSEIPQSGYYPSNLSDFSSQQEQILSDQRSFVENIKDIGEPAIRTQLLSKANVWIDSKIATLPEGTLTNLYDNKLVQASLSYFGMGAPVDLVATNTMGRIAISMGYGPTLGWLGEVTGSPYFGVTMVRIPLGEESSILTARALTGSETALKIGGSLAGGAAGAALAAETAGTATAIATTGGVMASEAFLGGAGAAAGATAGSVVPVVGTIIGAVAGFISSKILSKIPWQKIGSAIKKSGAFVVGLATAAIATPFVGLGAGVALGFASTGVAMAAGAGAGGLTFAGMGRGVVGFVGAVTAATIGAIGIPILAILIGFPVVVALILFIINSGAYMVPQASVSGGGFGTGLGGVACTQDRVATGINYSVNSPIATRALGIMEDMYQGFWCYFNRSASNIPWNGQPRTGFPNDSVQFPRNYPDWFNYDLFAANPNPSESAISNCAYCMFWCTTLVQEAYKSANVAIQDTLWAPTMKDDFNSRSKFLSNDLNLYPSKVLDRPTPSNVVPGSVIFFQVNSGDFANIINHVGIVYSIQGNVVTFLQANAGMKTGTLNYSGSTWSYINGITVAGFGLP